VNKNISDEKKIEWVILKVILKNYLKQRKKKSEEEINHRSFEKTDDKKEVSFSGKKLGTNETGESGIISIQKADGSWILEEVVSLLKLDKGVVESRNPCNNITLWITVITVCHLEKIYASTKELWQLVAKKATIYIKKQCKSLNLDYDNIIQNANQFLN